MAKVGRRDPWMVVVVVVVVKQDERRGRVGQEEEDRKIIDAAGMDTDHGSSHERTAEVSGEACRLGEVGELERLGPERRVLLGQVVDALGFEAA